MRIAEQTLAEQLRISDREIENRRRLNGLTDEDLEILSSIKRIMLRGADGVVEGFYSWLLDTENLAQYVGDAETLYRLKNHLRHYVLRLFDGQCDIEYVLARLRNSLGGGNWLAITT